MTTKQDASVSDPNTVSVFDDVAVEQLRRSQRMDPQQVRALRNDLFKHFRADEVACDRFSASDSIDCHTLSLFRSVNSKVDGATKLLFRTQAGLLIESVILRIATGRNTVCVSSQVGCAAACDFCATGKMGIARNLNAAEILDQVLQAGQHLATEDRRLDNVVFMGMGEPFHNEDHLYEVLTKLTSPKHFARSPGSLLVSTVGIPEAMERCVRTFPDVNLALSLHSADQNTRKSIIPLAARHPLSDLHAAVKKINAIQQRELMIEYLMLKDVNDSPAAATQLINWLEGLSVHVNLIPYNPIDDAPQLQPTPREEIFPFANQLKSAGYKTTIRYSLGNDIAAACGQLVRKQNLPRPGHPG